MKLAAVALPPLLLAPSMAHAEGDTGAIMAALRDEAAECRYLTQLCEEARAARTVAVDTQGKYAAAKGRHDRALHAELADLVKPDTTRYSQAELQAHEAYDKRCAADPLTCRLAADEERARQQREADRKATQERDRKRAASEATGSTFNATSARYSEARQRWVKAHNDAVAAAKVLAAKHAEPPACLAACADEVSRAD